MGYQYLIAIEFKPKKFPATINALNAGTNNG
jgi:hypothetical protein